MEEHVRVSELQLVVDRQRLDDDLVGALDAVAELALPEPDSGDAESEFELESVASRTRAGAAAIRSPRLVPVDRFVVSAQLAPERALP